MIPVFRKAFHDSQKLVVWLGVFTVAYVLLIMAFYPSIVDQSANFDRLMESYPKEMLTMFYGGDVADLSVSEPGNYVQAQFVIFMELMMGAIVIYQAFNALTNAERDGTLDVMLSLPVTRRRYLLGRIANTVAVTLILLIATWLTLWLSKVIWPQFDVSAWRLALGIMGAFFPLMVIAGFAYLLAAVVPSRRHFAGPVSYLFLFGSYLLYMLATSVRDLHPIKSIFLFDYYNAGQIIRSGVAAGDWVLLSAVALAYFGLAYWAVDRKDLGV